MAGPYRYPVDNKDRYRSKIQFQAIKVIPPEFTSQPLSKTTAEALESLISLNRNSEQERAKIEAQAGKKANLSPMQLDILDGELCDLYMPVSYQVSDRMGYETPELGVVGASTLAGLNAGSGALASIAQGITTGFQSITDLFTKGVRSGDLGRLAAVRASQSFIGKALPKPVTDAISIAAQVTVNPNVRAAFRNVGLRRFTFNFKLIAKSADEAEEIKSIVRFFRYHAYPEEISAGGLPLGYKYPNLFKIKLLHQASANGRFVPIGSTIKLSYLESISTNYNATAAVFHADGNPVEVDLNLNFVEYKTLSRNDVLLDGVDYDPDLAPYQPPLTDTEGSF